MSEVTITVRGEHEERTAPERATVHVTTSAEGPDRAAVVDSVMQRAEPVRTSMIDRVGAGLMADWTSKRLAVRAERPWNNEGKRLALVYTASIDFTATFTEASELSIWVSDISAWDGVEVGGVNWHLTAQTHAELERKVATAAVGDAVARAEAYAEALGLSTVTPAEIADAGLISSEAPAPARMMRAGAAFAAESAPAMEYEPEDIVVSATVEARFLAR